MLQSRGARLARIRSRARRLPRRVPVTCVQPGANQIVGLGAIGQFSSIGRSGDGNGAVTMVQRRVLLGQLEANGDCVYATTVARQIKTDNPDCHLTWAIGSRCRN